MDENGPYREAYRLERIVRGAASIIVTFYSAKEARTVIPSLNDNYRLMQGDKQIWPSKGSSERHR
ncbi:MULTISPECIES: hypothetical protein [unclassified Mesorhizobium]|uniref:hypothetical protein n=1 Tax=unclassified Mesorhizobium TaxID=325217 RepID=UPI000FCB59A4|nr:MULTISPECIES: hypothetical protein [unclassified Mesorhizobium]TGP74261.1 hypothetical protein EN870_27785 [bacterium M00.F.Ca.ET.227.01.1.1]TGU04519.1 hypothetical protein EN806_39470 [bacterium M00.F.Ca.ET.163.01.1.1]TGU33860.1 hypothetical protein EN799_23140 [bacterium M00.F.Ca.ET.156.01.1.1]TGU43387.1 hypothetical protein EN789_28210 [bacterium M00.F.Ca.ET.146.01.1.1]TGV76226.1 hypothetical protein EN792_053080 [Mesorhizobium sp. M00.F.Ca.ET.149.01.1.1]TGW09058.1 hypothetical protein 